MGLVPEDRAGARSDEPEARSEARWRERASFDTSESVGARWPVLRSCPRAIDWLGLQRDLGRSPRTVHAYARSLADYLAFCDRVGVDATVAGRAQIARYVRDLRERPGRHGANVIVLGSDAGLSAATLQLRVTVVRLFYDFLVEERVRDRNPVGRGYRSADGCAGRRGLVGRTDRLPWIPTDAQWRAVLEVAAGERLRNRLMLALAYDAGLRREELCLLGSDDLDPAHRTITVRAETTKSRRSRVVPYSEVSGQLLAQLPPRAPADHDGARRVVRVRIPAESWCRGVAVDVVEGGPVDRSARGRPGVQHAHVAASVLDGSRAVGVGDRSDRLVRRAPLDGHDPALHPPFRP